MKSSTCAEDASTEPARATDRESSMPSSVGCVLCLLALTTLVATPHPALGQEKQKEADQRPKTHFTHLNGPILSSSTLSVRNEREFLIQITDTCEEEFVYQVRGFRRERPPEPQTVYSRAARGDLPTLSDVEITISHDDTYGGYLVDIVRPDRGEAQSTKCVDAAGASVELEPAQLVIAVPKWGWETTMSTGFSLSPLVNEACAVDKPDRPDRCSSLQPGLVSFFHVHHTRMDWWAPMFGTGLSDGQPEYYIGVGLRLGSEATFNSGLVVGKVKVGFGENPPTRFKRTWFVGVSYRLIGDGGGRAPFAGVGQ